MRVGKYLELVGPSADGMPCGKTTALTPIKQLVGCGKTGKNKRYRYKDGAYGLFTAITLCDNCYNKQTR